MIALHRKTALVTGGGRGIGRAAVVMLARAGADVAIGFRSRDVQADAAAAEVRSLGRRAIAVGGDLSSPGASVHMVARVAETFGRLDIFVANAGVWPPEDIPLARLTAERWRDTMAANLDAVYHSTRAALGLMGPGGRIVLVSSTAGQRGEAGHADYAATKGALIALTKSLAVECAPDILVNCVAPGWVAAPFFAGHPKSRIAAAIPLGRIPTAEQIAGPIVFLCSDLASHITGEILNVNGGSVLCG
jgi:3-oxoacyl-[acyl-carrier protein] reductase